MSFCRLTVTLLVLVVSLAVASPATATSFDNRPKILLHAKSKTTKNPCDFGTVGNCQTEVVSKGTLTDANDPNTFYFVYILAVKASMPNMAGVQFGIEYEGGYNPDGGNSPINIAEWTLCGTLEFKTVEPAWPAPGSGNLITWSTSSECQTGEVGVAGFFYLGAYAPGMMTLDMRPVDNVAKLADCTDPPFESEPLLTKDLGFVAFSAGAITEGCNPCLTECMPVAVQPTTWSGIKSLIGR